MKILVLYYTKTGHTLEAVNAVAEGIRSTGSEVDLVAVGAFRAGVVAAYDGLIVGSPCWAGSISSGGVAKPVLRALGILPEGALKGKRGGGVSVHCSMGGDTTVKTLGRLQGEKGCEDYRPGPVAKAGSPLSLWKGRSVGADDVERFKAYGAAFVA